LVDKGGVMINYLKNLISKKNSLQEKVDKVTTEAKGEEKHILDMHERAKVINNISPSFCTAKWVQETLLLFNGMNHSCHHPEQHKIPIEELKDNPSALHNTKFKKAQRKKMLEGERPEECQYCWNIEDLEGEHTSDRIYKSTNVKWSFNYVEEIIKTGHKGDINPSYMEVAFDNTCNLKCAYCSPDISTKWMEEINKFGPYDTRFKHGNLDWIKNSGRMPYHHKEENPYVEAFWKWWPELYTNLVTFRITGGEPLLSQHTWKVLDLINSKPKSELDLAINTNLCIMDKLVDKLIDNVCNISPKINSFDIYTSCEAHGKQAEYIRFGLDYEQFIKNIDRVLTNTPDKVKVHIMITFNALSVTSFVKFLEDVQTLRNKFNKDKGHNRIPMMISYLRWPSHLSVKILPEKNKIKFSEDVTKYINHNSIDKNDDGTFYIYERDQVERLVEYMMNDDLDNNEKNHDKNDFSKYFKEYDKRKGTSFNKVFPELRSMINS
jgi:molybdenum cofactor biosynthesis enzyme MoaA